MYSVPPDLSIMPVETIESMWAGVSTPLLISHWARWARAMWCGDGPALTLPVVAWADPARPFKRSMNPMVLLLSLLTMRVCGIWWNGGTGLPQRAADQALSPYG